MPSLPRAPGVLLPHTLYDNMTDVGGGDHKNDNINEKVAKKIGKKVYGMTYNVRRELNAGNITLLSELFSELDQRHQHPDFVCLQEVSKQQWKSCEKTKPKEGTLGEFAAKRGYKAFSCFAKGKAAKGEWIGMLYDPSRLELVTYGLLDAWTGTHAMARRVFHRQPLLAVFRAKLPDGTLGQPFKVNTFHLKFPGKRDRESEVMWLCVAKNSLKMPTGMLSFEMGDANVPQDNEQWKFWKHVPKGEKGKNDYMHLLPCDESTMTSGTGSGKSFDCVLTRPDQKRRYDVSSKVLYGKDWKALSDHYPVLTEFDAPGIESSDDDARSNLKFIKNLEASKRPQDKIGKVFHLEGLVEPKLPPLPVRRQS